MTKTMDNYKEIAEQAAQMAIEKATKAAQAIEDSRKAQLDLSDKKLSDAIAVALKDVFGEKENSGRFIDTSRIPLICQDIKGIHTELSGIQDNMKWIIRLIIGAVIMALLGLIFIHQIPVGLSS